MAQDYAEFDQSDDNEVSVAFCQKYICLCFLEPYFPPRTAQFPAPVLFPDE